jgi:hypothetical protein
MKNIQDIAAVLKRMAHLLRLGERDDWANAFEKFKSEIENSPNDIAAGILSMYGGMGSLNDLVLYRHGQPLIAENVELDELRSELYQLCHEIS